MIDTLFDRTAIPVLEQVVGFTQARHAVLAGNVANADTPGYRVRDLSTTDFERRLREAIVARDAPAALASSADPLSSASRAGHAVFDEVRESLKNVLFHDDSNVDLEQQVNELNKNKGQHDLAISVLRSQFSLLQAAISERA